LERKLYQARRRSGQEQAEIAQHVEKERQQANEIAQLKVDARGWRATVADLNRTVRELVDEIRQKTSRIGELENIVRRMARDR
jgi:hypothetical protein